MADKDTLWTAVKAGYATDLLLGLTNIYDRPATAIDDTVGTAAAQQTIDYFPLYGEVVYDAADTKHVAVAIRGVIAVLLERGGVSAELARDEWGEVFGDGGLLSKLRSVGPRARQGPTTNSGVTQKAETMANGSRVRGWSDRESLPLGIMPSRRSVNYD